MPESASLYCAATFGVCMHYVQVCVHVLEAPGRRSEPDEKATHSAQQQIQECLLLHTHYLLLSVVPFHLCLSVLPSFGMFMCILPAFVPTHESFFSSSTDVFFSLSFFRFECVCVFVRFVIYSYSANSGGGAGGWQACCFYDYSWK